MKIYWLVVTGASALMLFIGLAVPVYALVGVPTLFGAAFVGQRLASALPSKHRLGTRTTAAIVITAVALVAAALTWNLPLLWALALGVPLSLVFTSMARDFAVLESMN
jgi:hypothetical protein